MAGVAQQYAPFETQSVIPDSISYSGVMKRSPIVSRQTGLVQYPNGSRDVTLTGSGTQVLQFRLASADTIDFSKCRLLMGASLTSASNSVSILESGHAPMSQIKITVAGVEVDYVQYAAPLAAALTSLTNQDYQTSQGILNGNILDAVQYTSRFGRALSSITLSTVTSPTNVYPETSFAGAALNVAKAQSDGQTMPLAIDLSFLSVFSNGKLLPTKYLSNVLIEITIGGPNTCCVNFDTNGASMAFPSAITYSNIRLQYDTVRLSDVWYDAMDRYLSDPNNELLIPFNSYDTQRFPLPTSAASAQLNIMLNKRFVKTVLHTMYSNSAMSATSGCPRWAKMYVFGINSSRLQVGSLVLPQNLQDDRASLAAYSSAAWGTFADALGGGSSVFNDWGYATWKGSAADYLAQDGGTIQSANGGQLYDLQYPWYPISATASTLQGRGNKLTKMIVIHSLEAESHVASDDQLSGTNLTTGGSNMLLQLVFDGTTNAALPSVSGTLFVLTQWAGVMRLKGNTFDVIS